VSRWAHYAAAWEVATTINTTQFPAGGDLQVQLAGEIANYLQWAGLWTQLEHFLGVMLPEVADHGCADRGMHCDSDLVALASLQLRLAGGDCVGVLDLLETWPFVSADMSGRGPATYTNYALDAGMWGGCVVQLAEAKAGRTLTPVERKHAILARPPPSWILPQNF